VLSRAPWQPDYALVAQRRQAAIILWRDDPRAVLGARQYYRTRPTEFVEDWCNTYDPRNATDPEKMATMPFVPFARQRELVQFMQDLMRYQASGLIEKSRDMGATWLSCAFSVWLWLFVPGVSVGWGSRKEMLVDKNGDPDSIFEKIRMLVRGLPPELLPVGFRYDKHSAHMRLVNPETDATITGEVGDNIGRGGRKSIYFKDESAHYEHPELIEAALMDNTNVQVDISSVNGLGNIFHRRREGGVDWVPGTAMERSRTYVFVMDWRDHPLKDQQWYAARKKKSTDEGLLHKFRQEVDRDYAASLEGVIILPEWVQAAVDADQVLGLEDDGGWCAALDVADGGLDLNALTTRKGIFIKSAEEWGERDTGTTTRRAVAGVRELGHVELQYDCVGVGSGVKAEWNRLKDDKLAPKAVHMVPWNAADEVKDKDRRLIPGDLSTPLNGDLFGNFKAQGWWHLARRFEKTFRAVRKAKGDPDQQDFTWQPDELICIRSADLPREVLLKLIKQLSQAVFTQSTKLKLIVDKAPEGTRSPNMADGVMMMFWPASSGVVRVGAEALNRLRAMPPRHPVRRY
jgi:hypothetical protein